MCSEQQKVTIAVFVEGGNVSSVYADDPDVAVILVDYDNIDAGDAEPEVPDAVRHQVY